MKNAIITLLLILPTLALALSGKVIKVSDGDTTAMLQDKKLGLAFFAAHSFKNILIKV